MEILRSPIIQAMVAFGVIFAAAFAFLPHQLVNDILDSFCVAGCIVFIVRFHAPVAEALRARRPDAPAVWLVAISGTVLSVGLIRALREVGLELGLLESPAVGYVFGGITVLMVFSIFLQIAAPPFRHGTLRLSPWAALAIAFVSGTLMASVVIGIRYF